MAAIFEKGMINLDYFTMEDSLYQIDAMSPMDSIEFPGAVASQTTSIDDDAARSLSSSSPSSIMSLAEDFWDTVHHEDQSAQEPHGFDSQQAHPECNETVCEQGASSLLRASAPLDNLMQWEDSLAWSIGSEVDFPSIPALSSNIAVDNITAFSHSSIDSIVEDTPSTCLSTPSTTLHTSHVCSPARKIKLRESSVNTNVSRFNTCCRTQQSRLTQAQLLHLRSIAMPYNSSLLSSRCISEISSSPEPEAHKDMNTTDNISTFSDVHHNSSKQRVSVPTRSSKHKPPYPPPKKTAHNMIEKRYRTNLNDKIAALRDSVPAFRARDNQVEDLGGLAPAHKLKKATVLSRATEYIAHLEKRVSELDVENLELQKRIRAFEMLFGRVEMGSEDAISRECLA